jgi:hypothetical protein
MHSELHPKNFWFTSNVILAHTESVWGKADRLKNQKQNEQQN